MVSGGGQQLSGRLRKPGVPDPRSFPLIPISLGIPRQGTLELSAFRLFTCGFEGRAADSVHILQAARACANTEREKEGKARHDMQRGEQ